MQSLPPEVLALPSPLIAIVHPGETPLAGALARALSATHAAATATAYYGSPSTPAPRSRFEPFSLSHAFPVKGDREGGAGAAATPSPPPPGVLRAGWMAKHQTLVPGAVLLVIPLDVGLTADAWPALEAAVLTSANILRSTVGSGRPLTVGCALVSDAPRSQVVAGGGEGWPDRLAQLRRRGGWEGGEFAVICGEELGVAPSPPTSPGGRLPPPSPLLALEAALRGAAHSYYKTTAKRWKAEAAALASEPSSWVACASRARALFKVAHFAEFRGKAAQALKYYASVGKVLANAPITLTTASCTLAVADLASFKVQLGMLAHGFGPVVSPSGMEVGAALGGGAQAAVMAFQHHIRSFERVVCRAAGSPVCDADGPHFSEWQRLGWLARQHTLAAELLSLNLPPPRKDTKPHLLPSHYFHTAGVFAAKQRVAAVADGVRAYFTPGGVLPWTRVDPPPPSGWVFAAPTFVGGPPSATRDRAPAPTPLEVAAAQSEQLRWVEACLDHPGIEVGLFEQAQKRDPTEPGVGDAPRSLLSSPGAPPGMDADSLCVDPGSNFSYVVSATTSQTRLWRATCVGDALFAGGRVAEAARLWVGVAQASRVHALPPQLWTGVVTKLRNAGAALHESALFVTTSLELVGGADGDATPACRREWLEAAAATLSSRPRLPVYPAPPTLLSATVGFTTRALLRGDLATVRITLHHGMPVDTVLDRFVVKWGQCRGNAGDALNATGRGEGQFQFVETPSPLTLVVVHSLAGASLQSRGQGGVRPRVVHHPHHRCSQPHPGAGDAPRV